MRLDLGLEAPEWVSWISPRVPLGVHGAPTPGALVVLEGPRGHLATATVLESSASRAPDRWERPQLL